MRRISRASREKHPGYWSRRRGSEIGTNQVERLEALCFHAKWMANRWQRELGPALQALGSRHAQECHEHIIGAARLAHTMQRAAGTMPPGL
ncbi:hypothetical protein [Halomonas sp. TA6]|nr:hypothetical protein [Halomonas sp. TA6]